MIQLIVFIIFTVSVLAAGFMLYRKIPVLLTLPENGATGLKKPAIAAKVEKKVKDLHFRFFAQQLLLHKVLSKFRILVLKVERFIDVRLHGIRKKAQELDNEIKKR